MCLYYDLVFVLKGIRTLMCKQCFILSTWKCVFYVLHMITYVTICVAFVWVATYVDLISAYSPTRRYYFSYYVYYVSL